MSDAEIMAAIGVDQQQHLDEDEEKPLPPPPTMKSKKSFMQKLMEGHEALKMQMQMGVRSPKLDGDDDVLAQPSRASSSSSVSKDFFKMATTAKSERPIAMRYDDISDSAAPTPVFVASPLTPSSEASSSSSQEQKEKDVLARTQRQCRRESSVMEMNATHRLYTSYSMSHMGSSATSPRTAVRFAPPLKARARSLPSQMTDEQMDAWLDMPEDADAHRLRKASEASARAEYVRRNVVKRKPVARADSAVAISPVVFKRDNPFSYDADEARREIEKMFAPDADAGAEDATEKDAVSFAAMPVEVVLRVARLLNAKDVRSCRQTCRKMCENMPAPQQPLAAKKT